MRPVVIFETLSLLSERDRSAKRVTFGARENLLLGENETGKSRIIKHLFWVLGCEPPKRASGSFDSNVVASLIFTLGQRKYIAVRENRKRGMFSEDGRLIFATASAGKWNKFFAEFFDFPLKLQRHEEGVFDHAGPEYALLPYYIDQDASWGTKWATFTRLGQFKNWQRPVFDSFSGLKIPKYLEARIARDEVTFKLRELRQQDKVQAASYIRVVKMLPADPLKLDEKAFFSELREIAKEVEQLSSTQEEIRAKLVRIASEREQAVAELRLAKSAEEELLGDVAYLANIPDATELECPTCGTLHRTSFHARLELAGEAESIHELIVKLQRNIEHSQGKEAGLRRALSAVGHDLGQLQQRMDKRHEGKSMSDVVSARSRQTLDRAYDESRRSLRAEIDILDEEKDNLDQELAKYENKEREKNIRSFFADELRSFSDRLGINKAELASKSGIGSRPPSGGSSGPRGVLAVHLSLLSANREYGVGPIFPFVIDTPQQSGQDPLNLTRMMTSAFDQSNNQMQVFIATETLPTGWNMEVENLLQFSRKRQLLNEESFNNEISFLAPLMNSINAIVTAEQEEESAQSSIEQPEEESEGWDDLDEEGDDNAQ